MNDWRERHKFVAVWRESYSKWRRMWKLSGPNIRPFTDGDPEASWTDCPSAPCATILNGKLYKCPPVAFLPMLRSKLGDLRPEWDPYLDYQPLEPGCTDEELEEFLARKAEPCCGMCPAEPELLRLPCPIPGVEE